MQIKPLLFITLVVLLTGCRSNIPPEIATIIDGTHNKKELLKVIDHYKSAGDSLKLMAVYYLIKNMDDQYHYSGPLVEQYHQLFRYVDSLEKQQVNPRDAWDNIPASDRDIAATIPDTRIKDIDVIKADFLISNINDAFTAWRYPWAKHLTFGQFCKYILPYKLKNEPIANWRQLMLAKFKWVADSLKNEEDAKRVVCLINNDLQKWFYISPKFSYPYDLNINDLLTIKVGRCDEATQLTAYALRAMGIPVTLDFSLLWANKKGGHAWNSLLTGKTPIIFMGTESNPGYEKIQNSGYGTWGALSMERKRAKILRYCYPKQVNAINKDENNLNVPSAFLNKHIEDVTSQFIPVSTVSFECKNPALLAGHSFSYLCVFNDRKWKPVAWNSVTKKNSICFENMGRDIVYLPAVYKDNNIFPIHPPLLLTKSGALRQLEADETKLDTIIITRKYPEDAGNAIFPGKNYEVYYWKNEWISMGQQFAKTNYLIYPNAPGNALFYVRNLDEGFQERIFTFENGKQIWW
jgi:hypothetical protein